MQRFYSNEEIELIVKRIEKLYWMQGYKTIPGTEETIPELVSRIVKKNYEIKDILAGIDRLFEKENKVSLPNIIESIKLIREEKILKSKSKYISEEDTEDCSQKISRLKQKWGKDWWRHYNDT